LIRWEIFLEYVQMASMTEEKEPDYSVAWKGLLVVLAIVLISRYIDAHRALKAVLSRGK
jgi:hypothetical protein